MEQLKEKWRIEKEQRLQLNKEKREMEREQLQQQHMKASQVRKLLIQQKKDHEANEKARLRDLLTTSLQDKHVMQASKLEMDHERRRQSVLLNEKIREAGRKQIAHEREQHKQKQRLEIELRRIDFLEVKQKKKLEELRRRESLQFHTEQAKMQSLKGKNEIAVRAEEEEKNLREQRRENWRDEQSFKQEQKRRARESIAFRLQCWRQEKKNSEQRHQLHAEQEKFDLLLRSEDHKALQEHKLKEKKSERESLAGRLQEWREQRDAEKERAAIEDEAKQIELELKRQEQEDIAAFEEAASRSRRQSLAFRLEEAKRGKSWEYGKKAFEKVTW